ncbi:gluconate 2-dehydrogenase subunit 3 family protein [Rhodohalobacter sp. SW132]|uniref:gluconate 2-dehydrogenase subunit 3 family protein n=1 Tax=Rhodohalobacter sp. SW132 TaxID=2293433 RepID=UPI000E26484F|nr:gluconate 2-dehydrogenase subunit 3 family protein [Rhodohalobacter sp. SW132]REL32955.1 gluconate 2-dehydrogenase subunit 3 family protein [Rhodohalobacter sp. SW132]
MDRREHLKLLFAGSIGTGLLLSSCTEEDLEISRQIITENSETYGRTDEELLRDQQLHSDTFFTEHEREMVEVLADLIIPSDERSGSATEAGVPDFIEFMMKDIPSMQTPTRGGLMWLDNQCRQRFGETFANCSESDQKEILDEIAYPDEARDDMQFGVRFFNRMRNLTATGFFTSKMGIEDLGYQGNRTNLWDGVPQHVLDKHGLSYDQKTLDESLQEDERNKIAEWDENGNLIR